MKKIYIAVLIVFCVSVFLFLISFVYLDKHNHQILHYDISVDGRHVGTVRLDKFVTEEKRIYKSVAFTPFRELFTETRARIELDRKYNLESYQKDLFTHGAIYPTLLFYAENKDNYVSFLSRYMSRFRCLNNVPIRKGAFIFEEDSPVTYLPIIENYDFNRGRSQGFNSIIYFSDPRLPPVKKFVTLTSIKNEYLKIGRRKIKSENLLLKIRGLPPGSVWVARSDKTLMMIDIPSIGLKVTRSFEPKDILPKEREAIPAGYASQDVIFHNKNKQFSGTLTMPVDNTSRLGSDGKVPAALLIWGAGPQDRNYQGLFSSISDYLSKSGYAVLRFDKRGIGASNGDALSATRGDEFEDISAALNFLKSQKGVDANRIALIAHSEGAMNALKLAAANKDTKAVVLMAPLIKITSDEGEAMLRDRAVNEKWDEGYLKLALDSVRQTGERAGKTKSDWGYILGKKCYLKDVRKDETIRPAEIVEGVSAPMLILYGKGDVEIPAAYAERLNKFISEHGMTNRTVAYFGYLGHYFGMLSGDGASRMRYDVDKEVLGSIRAWLDLND